MDRKERVFSYINSAEYIPLTQNELALVLDVPGEDLEEFYQILDELASEGRVFLTKKKRYAPCEKNDTYSGTLRTNARGRFGFVTVEGRENDIFIPPDDLGTAIDGDLVLVRLTGRDAKKPEGTILSVLKRGCTTISAVMTDDFAATPDNKRIFKDILLDDVQDAKYGDRVLVELTEFSPNGRIYGQVVSVLGSSRDIKSYSEAIIFANGIKPGFPEDVIRQADSTACEVSPDDIKDREDLTDKIIFTIDGDDARDFDDAVSLECAGNGSYLLGVHIADVTHYVTEGSPLDREAHRRGTSVYLADRVIPMLPKKLSNGICSLNPGVLRLTLSVFMEIDEEGNVVNHRLSQSVIRSCRRMTYNNVAKILDGDPELTEEYSDISGVLHRMHALAKTLSNKRVQRGSINFDFPEASIVLGDNGLPVDIIKDERNDAHKLIEEFMLIANETVAEYAFWADIPFVFRVHDEPDAEKMEAFRRFIGNFGLFIKGNEVHPKDLQQILEQIEGMDNRSMISTYMLRSLMKAEYKSTNDGHFGLAAKYYCHFTSPIRRYPDLTIHRILKDFISGKDIMHYASKVDEIAKHSSDTERQAELCEREVSDLYKCAYMERFVGETFHATVSGVTSFGMFAELENTVEGLIRLETIADDYYEYNEELRALIGKRKNKVYTIGDRIEIEVVRSDLALRQIDFVLKGSKPLPSKKPVSGTGKFKKFASKKYKSKRKK